ncbi:GH25 family lysozyme [Companilactobacillus metriopterae]|uniref:GH25 family lysozyme n=1 Tax=Companilactobacillus metriopterae TaxID=1909267 RepID=UPI001F51294F|nr:GH25 family lysozyme [Companilactobacillus metriopterae]
MKKKMNRIFLGLTLVVLFFMQSSTVLGARTDMVDVSNHNGYMTVSNFTDMRNNYGVKSVVTKISEGTYYSDYTASNNIATAQQAGLYINGYHYAKYTNETQAVAEGNYAGAQAQKAGLPVGAVLVADVEDSSQSGVSKSQMNANNTAFMNTVKAYGYRTDVYTMGSWVGSKMDISNGTGWIASYPYNASDKNWYTNNNAWQWGSTYTFTGSYGNFDVSQLNNDFYTGGQPALVDTNSTINNIVSVKGDKYAAYSTVKADGSLNYGTDVVSGTNWVSGGIYQINGKPYFAIGLTEYLPQSSTTFKDKVVINYRSDYGVLAYNSKGEVIKDSNKRFTGGTEWKTEDKLVHIKNIGWSYKVATDEYIPVTYMQGSGYTGE